MRSEAQDYQDRHDDGYEPPWDWGYTEADYLPLEVPGGYRSINGDEVEDHRPYKIFFCATWWDAVRRPGYLHIPYWYAPEGNYITGDTNVEAYAEQVTP